MASSLQIDSLGSDDWELIADVEIDKSPGDKSIQQFGLGVSIDTNFVAIAVTSTSAKSHWSSGGFIAQSYELGDFQTVSHQHFVRVNQVTVIRLEQVANLSFDLVYDAPNYFDNVRVIAWEYVGVEKDLLIQDLIDTLQNITLNTSVDLTEIHDKLDVFVQRVDERNSQKLIAIEQKLDEISNCLIQMGCTPRNDQAERQKRYFYLI